MRRFGHGGIFVLKSEFFNENYGIFLHNFIQPFERPFTRQNWRMDHLLPTEKIPFHCENKHGFVMNVYTAALVGQNMAKAKTLQFRNDDIFITGIMRLKVTSKLEWYF